MSSFINLNAVPKDMHSTSGANKSQYSPNHTTLNGKVSPEIQDQKDAIQEAAHDFEAAFITQMLTFSGLGKALTTGGGEAMSAFTGFYIESFAEQMTEAGGLGLAERFYTNLLQSSGLTVEPDALGSEHTLNIKESQNDDLGLL